MQDTLDDKTKQKIFRTVVAVAIAAIAILFVVNLQPKQDASSKTETQATDRNDAKKRYAESNVALVKSSLAVYYVQNGSYPVYLSDAYADLAADDEFNIDDFKKALKDLKTEYAPRGDFKSYQLSYCIFDNCKTDTVTYEEDYQKSTE